MKFAQHIKLTTLPALLFVGTAQAQIFWNPTQTDPYSPVGGNANWRDANVWWNPTTEENFTPAVNSGQLAYFEGSGSVGGTGNEPARMFIQNTTGVYNFTGAVNLRLPNNNTGDALHVTGNHDVNFTGGFGISAGTQGNRNIRNDGTGTITINDMSRQFGGAATNLTILGNGNVTINGFGNMGGTLTQSGGGRLTHNARLGADIGSTGASGFTSIVVNDGEYFANGQGNTSMTWNAGTLVFNLSNVDNTSNSIDLEGAFTKGGGSSFVFDFENTGALNETYTLMSFGSTTFDLTDFSATNTVGGSFSLGSTTINDVELTTLQYTVIPEPGTLALVGIALGSLLLFRRRR